MIKLTICMRLVGQRMNTPHPCYICDANTKGEIIISAMQEAALQKYSTLKPVVLCEVFNSSCHRALYRALGIAVL